jgi:outer membrane protein TolC
VNPYGSDALVDEYEIRGETHADVVQSIQRARTAIPELNGYDSVTDTDIRFELRDGRWRLTTSIRVVLPQVATRSDEVRECFARYRKALEEHEALHVQSSRRHIEDARAAVRTKDERYMRERNDVIQSRLSADRDETERLTNHGLPEAAFPPPSCRHTD